MMNQSIIEGNIIRDPELREFPDGGCLATFSIASDRDYKDANQEKITDFIPIVVKNELAQSVMQYARQGRHVLIQGRVQPRKYQDDRDQTRWITEIAATYIRYLDSAIPDSQEGSSAPSRGNSQQNGNGQHANSRNAQGSYNNGQPPQGNRPTGANRDVPSSDNRTGYANGSGQRGASQGSQYRGNRQNQPPSSGGNGYRRDNRNHANQGNARSGSGNRETVPWSH